MRNETVLTTDDIDGSAEAVPVHFAFQGVDYTIDLGTKNHDKLIKAFAPFIKAAKKQPRTLPQAGANGKAQRKAVTRKDALDPKVVRAWARANGIEVGDRTRIRKDVIDAYLAAN